MCVNHAREAECDIEIACARDGTILGLRGHAFVDVGAYMRTNGAVGARNIAQFMSGPYRIPHIDIDVALLLTNKTPVGTYRGPGRFETDFFRERFFDMVAQDSVSIASSSAAATSCHRARCRIRSPPSHRYESKDEFDSGDYHATLDRCLDEINWSEKSKLAGKLIDGRYHGLALGCFIEGGAAGPKESARIVLEPDGCYSVYVGLLRHRARARNRLRSDRRRRARSPAGAHPRRFSRFDLLCERWLRRLSLALGRDGRLGHARRGGEAARSDPRRGGEAARLRARRGRDRRRREGGCGRRQVGSLATLAPEGIAAEGAFLNKKHTYTYGAHAAHVAVDPKLGQVELIDYVVVEDCGRIINPLTVHGQAVGSVVQGLGGAMMEHLVYDQDGQLLTGSLADYLIPTASDFPNIRSVVLENHPSPINPLGAKGAGEGRHHRGRRRHGQCDRQRARHARRATARASAHADAHLGTGAGRQAQFPIRHAARPERFTVLHMRGWGSSRASPALH